MHVSFKKVYITECKTKRACVMANANCRRGIAFERPLKHHWCVSNPWLISPCPTLHSLSQTKLSLLACVSCPKVLSLRNPFFYFSLQITLLRYRDSSMRALFTFRCGDDAAPLILSVKCNNWLFSPEKLCVLPFYHYKELSTYLNCDLLFRWKVCLFIMKMQVDRKWTTLCPWKVQIAE